MESFVLPLYALISGSFESAFGIRIREFLFISLKKALKIVLFSPYIVVLIYFQYCLLSFIFSALDTGVMSEWRTPDWFLDDPVTPVFFWISLIQSLAVLVATYLKNVAKFKDDLERLPDRVARRVEQNAYAGATFSVRDDIQLLGAISATGINSRYNIRFGFIDGPGSTRFDFKDYLSQIAGVSTEFSEQADHVTMKPIFPACLALMKLGASIVVIGVSLCALISQDLVKSSHAFSIVADSISRGAFADAIESFEISNFYEGERTLALMLIDFLIRTGTSLLVLSFVALLAKSYWDSKKLGKRLSSEDGDLFPSAYKCLIDLAYDRMCEVRSYRYSKENYRSYLWFGYKRSHVVDFYRAIRELEVFRQRTMLRENDLSLLKVST